MGIALAVASLVVSVGAGVMQHQQQKKAQEAAEKAAKEQNAYQAQQVEAQKKMQQEQKAQQAQQAALERRRQVREERVRRAQITQASQNTGVVGSSGMLGALGGLATGLSANIGTNVGAVASGNRMSLFSQQAADAQTGMMQAQTSGNLAVMRAQNLGQMWGQVGSLSSSIFQGTGGFQNFGFSEPKTKGG